ncbi:MAG: hypothetical protein EPO35_03065 [Acidobacteria bacterium]|nr:MAG: hypothetical protein EPO35_03065 [Acidobacteriota bacterium]
MGFLSKLLGGIDKAEFGNVKLSVLAKREGTKIHAASCDACGKSFQWLETGVVYPIPLGVNRTKPDRALIDIGGWCGKCDRMLCQDEAEFIAFPMKGTDWWVAGCRQCQSPLGGKFNRDHRHKG